MDRREHGSPGPGGDTHRAAGYRQPPPVTFGRSKVRREAGVLAGAKHPGQRPVDQAQVTYVWNHDQGSPARGGRGACRARYFLGPVLAGQCRPDRAWCAAVGEGSQERGASRVAGPWPQGWARRSGAHRSRCRPRRVLRLSRAGRAPWPGRRFHPRVPRWDSQPEHIGEGARVPVGDLAGERRDFLGEHGLRRDDPLQGGQAARVVAGAHPFQQVAAGELAREPDPDPAAGNRRLGQPFRHEVVKRPVQVSERHIDGDPRNRQQGRHRRAGRRTAASGTAFAARRGTSRGRAL